MFKDFINFEMMMSFQKDPISVDEAKEWLEKQVPKVVPVVGSIFNQTFDYQKLIYIYWKYCDVPEIKQRCENIIMMMSRMYEDTIKYLQRLHLNELPLSNS